MSKHALLFPGQGAQQVGMGRDLAESMPACRSLFDRAGEVLGYDLAAICFDGPIENLTVSAHAQPGIFVASMACWTALKEKQPDFEPAFTAGLSSGEWTALHMAGVIGFEDTLKVLEARGRFMQEACRANPGAMLSVIGADEAQLDRLCAASGAEKANLNSAEQTVISGPVASIDKAEALAKDIGIRRAIRLNVAGAFHSTLMKPAAEALAGVLESVSLSAPAIPVVSNVTGRPHDADPAGIRERMVAQVYSSVQWYESVRWMIGEGAESFTECGPGKVLSGLVKRIDKTSPVRNIGALSDLE